MVLYPAGRDEGKQAGGGAKEPRPRNRLEAGVEASGSGGEAGSRGGEEDEIHLTNENKFYLVIVLLVN